MNINFDFASLQTQRCLFSTVNSISLISRRLSSGLRINSASDDAANCSLSKNLDTKVSGLNVANNNIQTGVSKLQTLDGYLSGITNNLQRLRSLAIQSSNGVYAASERKMLNNEAQSLLEDIEQASNQSNVEVGAANTNVTGFISQVTKSSTVPTGYTAITSASQLQTAMNATLNGKFILMNDIDLSELGPVNRAVVTGIFSGTLDGNGYKLKNLTINSTAASTGFIGQTSGAKIKNIGLENANVTATGAFNHVGSLVGYSDNISSIDNCYTSNVSVTASSATNVGGLVGTNGTNCSVNNCYSTGNVTGSVNVGGLAGRSYNNCKVNNSYSNADIHTNTQYGGGLVGRLEINATMSNCYATGNVTGVDYNGGLIGGLATTATVSSCYATGNVTGARWTGGFAGNSMINSTINSCYATGNINASNSSSGGFIGNLLANCTIQSCYATGSINATNNYAGGFVGLNNGAVLSSYCTGDTSNSATYTGGFAGGNSTGGTITSSYSTGSAKGTNSVGGFAGFNTNNAVITSSSSSGKVTGTINLGGFLGLLTTGTVDNTNFWNKDTSGRSTSAGAAVGMNNDQFNAQPAVKNSWNSTEWDLQYEQPQIKSIKNGNFGLQVGESASSTSFYGTTNLGLNYGGYLDLRLEDITQSLSAISNLDKTIDYITTKRVQLGSNMSALSSRLETNTSRHYNLTSTTSTLKDTDVAKEMMALARQQILQNMSVSVMKQSQKFQSQILLQLLSP
ncbi:MAG: GLUG motif-containing protein [bacterium]